MARDLGRWARQLDAWMHNWSRRLSGQLVLSHVFVAAVVLAFALGVAQLTFRHYLVRSQETTLASQADKINRYVMHPFFLGTWSREQASFFIRILQGTLSDRVLVFSYEGHLLLEAGSANVSPAVPAPSVMARVMDAGQNYRGTQNGLAVVGVPVRLARNNVAGSLFLESPLSTSSSTANSLTRLLLFGELGAIILVGALAYAIAGRLSGPLVKLRQVVAGTGRSGESENRRADEGEGPVEVQALAHEFNRLEDRIDTQMNQLRREAEARDALMAHVAHDLRTPLTSIRGFLEAVRDGVAVAESHDRAVEVAWEETLRLQRLVDRLLKATRIRSDGGTMEVLSTRVWVEKTLERIAPVLEQNELALQWDKQDDGPVFGNEDYLVEALLNLLDNAVKWSPPGSTIQVGTERRQETMAIWVKDQGPGIPEELLPRVFERFVTGDASRRQSSGLGLSIVDEVARQHRGQVTIHSQPNQGTVVELVLPLAEEDPA